MLFVQKIVLLKYNKHLQKILIVYSVCIQIVWLFTVKKKLETKNGTKGFQNTKQRRIQRVHFLELSVCVFINEWMNEWIK